MVLGGFGKGTASAVPLRAARNSGFSRLRTNSTQHLILGGAALQRCGNCSVLNAASAAEVTVLAQERLLPQPLSPCGWTSRLRHRQSSTSLYAAPSGLSHWQLATGHWPLIPWARFTFFPRELPTRSLPAKWSSVPRRW